MCDHAGTTERWICVAAGALRRILPSSSVLGSDAPASGSLGARAHLKGDLHESMYGNVLTFSCSLLGHLRSTLGRKCPLIGEDPENAYSKRNEAASHDRAVSTTRRGAGYPYSR